MAIKRYIANKDTTITNAFMPNLKTRGTKSNMGESDVLEIFSLYGQTHLTSSELARTLIDFPVSEIIQDRSNLILPQSGNVQFILKLSNAEHGGTTPKKINLNVYPVSSSWNEGGGLDMESYTDLDTANWLSSSDTTSWINPGSDYLTGSQLQKYFEKGNEDLEVDITSIVENWITGTIQPNGLIVKLPNSLESDSKSYYTKKFFSRGSQYFFKRPWIEARFDDSICDDRNSFYNSSSLAPAEYNINKIYLYNRHRGQLVDVDTTASLYCSLYTGTLGPVGLPLTLANTPSNDAFVLATRIRKGIYEAEIAVNAPSSYVYDVWHDGNGTYFYTGSAFDIRNGTGDDEEDFQIPDYVVNITNLKSIYNTKEKPRLNLYIRNKDWDPTIYTVAKSNADNFTIKEAFYKVYRVVDDLQVIPYSLNGDIAYSKLSYDGKGNYFDLDMSLFEPDYTYAIKFLFKEFDLEQEQREVFKFRVED